MNAFMNKVRRSLGQASLVTDQRGLTTVEYVIILVVIAVLSISVWKTFGGAIQAQIGNSTTAVEGLDTPAPAN